MPRRVESTIDITIWDDPAKNKRRAEVGRSFTLDTFQKHKSADYYIPGADPGPATETVTLADFGTGADAIRGVHIETDADIEVNVDFGAGAVTIPIVRPGPVGSYGQLYLDGSPVSMTLTNRATTGAASVVVTAWGSVTPA